MIHLTIRAMVSLARAATRSCLAVVLVANAASAFGHGGVSMEDDVCIIQLGPYKAHFTGYLPKERATQEFCEDIPVVTATVFVLDFISDELREMDLDFRIVRDVNNLGPTATYEDMGGSEAVEKATIFYESPRTYAKGVVNVRYSFAQEGGYIGVVDVHHRATGLSYRSVFPFAVGKTNYTKYAAYYVLLFVACGLFIWAAGRSNFFRPRKKR